LSEPDKRYTIAIVANATWNIYNFRMNVLSSLSKAGHKIYVIAPIDEYIKYRESFPLIEHIPLKKMKRKSINPFHDLALFFELLSIYRKINPDIVLHYTIKINIWGAFAARILKIRSLAFVTGLGYAFLKKGILKKISETLYKISFPYHDKVIFENEDDLQLFIDKKLIKKEQGLAIKGCGVDTSYFEPEEKPKSSKVIFTFIGRFLIDKGIKEFVGAAKTIREKHPNTVFQAVGDIDPHNSSSITPLNLQKWRTESQVDFINHQENIKTIISNSDCIVLPSYREGMPKVLLEGLSMAKPLITTDVPGCRELVTEGVNGFIVRHKSVDELIKAFEKFLAMEEKNQKAMGKEGRKMAIHTFDSEIIASKIMNIVMTVLKSSFSNN